MTILHHQRSASSIASDAEPAIYRKVASRLIPFLFLLYLIAFLDRVNIGFAKLQMSSDLGFSEIVYGTGAGIFFLGYFLFEIPSNIILHKIGAKIWIARILVLWGLVSSAMMWVDSIASFYLLRFLLGVGEAGFFPGVILYLTYWFPSDYRAKTTAFFMTAVAVSGVIGGPVSTAIMTGLDHSLGLRGWQWLFLLEGLPAVVLGVVTYFYLDNGPQQAPWLDDEERQFLLTRLAENRSVDSQASLPLALVSPQVWQLALAYFLAVLGLYGVSFWLPQIINDLKQGGLLATGLLSALPYSMALVVMLAISHSSDQRLERRWHIAASAGLGALGLLGLVWVRSSPWLSILALGIATSGILSVVSIFWAVPTALLSGRAAAGGIALINCVGNLGGYFGPTLLGWVRDGAGNMDAGLYLLAVGLLLMGLIILKSKKG